MYGRTGATLHAASQQRVFTLVANLEPPVGDPPGRGRDSLEQRLCMLYTHSKVRWQVNMEDRREVPIGWGEGLARAAMMGLVSAAVDGALRTGCRITTDECSLNV